VGQSERAGVYITNDGSVAWEWFIAGPLPAHLQPAMVRFRALWNAVRENIPAGQRPHALRALANALYISLHSDDDPLTPFAAVEQQVRGFAEANIAQRYLRGAIWGTATMAAAGAILAGLLAPSWSLVGWGAVLGTLSSLASVILRLSSGLSPAFAATQVTSAALYGGSRSFLGALFGALAVVAVKADILLSIVAGNAAATLFVAAAAGFSERFIPDLLEKVGEQRLKALEAPAPPEDSGQLAS